MAIAPKPATQSEADKAEPAPQATGAGSVPTPTQHECDSYVEAMVAGTLPHVVKHAQDGSPIDPSSPDPTPVSTPTWPAP
jgi:hypothetical protein